MMTTVLLCGLAAALFCITRAAEAIRRNEPRAPLWLGAAAVLSLPAVVRDPSAASLALLAGSGAILLYCFSSAIEEIEEEEVRQVAAVRARQRPAARRQGRRASKRRLRRRTPRIARAR